jgi:hypothetical protein
MNNKEYETFLINEKLINMNNNIPFPERIHFKYYQNSLYDRILNQFNNHYDFHIPSVDECKILHQLMRNVLLPKKYMTTEANSNSSVTLAFIRDGSFFEANRSEYQNVVLVWFQYKDERIG